MYTSNPNAPRARMNAVNLVRKGKGVRQVARYFGTSPGTITKWCRKASMLNQRHVIPTRSSRPHHSPKSIPYEIKEAITTKRLGPHPRCGAVIQKELENEGIKVILISSPKLYEKP